MARVSAAWRRFWGVRPGELERRVPMIARRRTMGVPRSGPHGRGWGRRRRH